MEGLEVTGLVTLIYNKLKRRAGPWEMWDLSYFMQLSAEREV